MTTALTELRAIGEETRLRIFYLLSLGELTVADLVEILDQSQPRVSRHLKLLAEAAVITRSPEGAQVFCRLNNASESAGLQQAILARIDEKSAPFLEDKAALQSIRKKREEKAATYFKEVAEEWDYVRSLMVPESDIEAQIIALTKGQRYNRHIDLGTGTGRMLALLQDRVEEGIGLDHSRDMLAVARARLADLPTERFSVRQADLYNLDQTIGSADLVTLHMVLHYLENPKEVLKAAAKLLNANGCFMLVDLTPHNHEELRQEHAHRRLGFARDELESWAKACGLTLDQHRLLEGGRLSAFIATFKVA